MPVLVQMGASTGTKDNINGGKTPLELAANDHIKELIIVHSAPPYIPKKEDLEFMDRGIEGKKAKIVREDYDPYGKNYTPKQAKKKINEPYIETKQKVEEPIQNIQK